MTLVIDRIRLSTLRRMVAQVEQAVDWYHLVAGMAKLFRWYSSKMLEHASGPVLAPRKTGPQF